MGKRAFIVVLDSFGAGSMPDAPQYGDSMDCNTIETVRKQPEYCCPNLEMMGLYTCPRLFEKSVAKDSVAGHWEMAGVISETPMPTYPNGFPKEIIDEFERLTGHQVICNKSYSGTEVLEDYGKESIEKKALIVYTSADSVFQIAAHEDIIPLEELYRCCQIAREMMTGDNPVGRVIARPFTGEWPYTRTPRRHDYVLVPSSENMLDILKDKGFDVISVGKIYDIFGGRGITKAYKTEGNIQGIEKFIELSSEDFNGLCYVNLVDFDTIYGHRRDAKGYAKAMSEFDEGLGKALQNITDDDLLIITADHGCDPKAAGTDHTRECVPFLTKGPVALKVLENPGFTPVSRAVLDFFGL